MTRLIAILLFSVVTLTGCGQEAPSSAVSASDLNEASPLAFARHYVEHVRNGATKDVYGAFLHTENRKRLESGDRISERFYQNALAENAVIHERQLLDGEVKVNAKADVAFIRFRLEPAQSLEMVYPDSPFAGEGYRITSGQINLKRDGERWGLIGHSLDAE